MLWQGRRIVDRYMRDHCTVGAALRWHQQCCEGWEWGAYRDMNCEWRMRLDRGLLDARFQVEFRRNVDAQHSSNNCRIGRGIVASLSPTRQLDICMSGTTSHASWTKKQRPWMASTARCGTGRPQDHTCSCKREAPGGRL